MMLPLRVTSYEALSISAHSPGYFQYYIKLFLLCKHICEYVLTSFLESSEDVKRNALAFFAFSSSASFTPSPFPHPPPFPHLSFFSFHFNFYLKRIYFIFYWTKPSYLVNSIPFWSNLSLNISLYDHQNATKSSVNTEMLRLQYKQEANRAKCDPLFLFLLFSLVRDKIWLFLIFQQDPLTITHHFISSASNRTSIPFLFLVSFMLNTRCKIQLGPFYMIHAILLHAKNKCLCRKG